MRSPSTYCGREAAEIAFHAIGTAPCEFGDAIARFACVRSNIMPHRHARRWGVAPPQREQLPGVAVTRAQRVHAVDHNGKTRSRVYRASRKLLAFEEITIGASNEARDDRHTKSSFLRAIHQ
ncbi:hypothetical protein WS71_04830 [Burkholderia mayonis]|uniref:Uncharacterized protein n=1 Tax=Burkholderia mayonis TaxID=1385591 RepID=A0A1B4FSR9_9BURK|nr:hypothetical protein WS71_04830 [Burkholderia mayonis]